MLEEGQYKLSNIPRETQEWWEAQAIVAVIGQNASVDSEEGDIEEMEHEDGAEIVGGEGSQRLRAGRLVCSVAEHGDIEVEEALAAADGSECEEIEAYAASGRWEEPAPYAGRVEGGVVACRIGVGGVGGFRGDGGCNSGTRGDVGDGGNRDHRAEGGARIVASTNAGHGGE